MAKKRLYVAHKEIKGVPPCTHETTAESKYYLPSEYSKKYNHCMFCAIDAWCGAMPHDEIALCLDVDRMMVCQTEKKVVKKLKERIGNFSGKQLKSLKELYTPNISVKGLSSRVDALTIEQLALTIGIDFDIQQPIDIRFMCKKVEMNNQLGKALYERKHQHHLITINKSQVKNKKDFVETLTHEMFHAAQVEGDSKLTEDADMIADAVMNELSQKYYRRFLYLSRKTKDNTLTGRRA